MKRAPMWLSKKSRQWVNKIIREYELEGHHEELLLQAAGCLDRIREAREAIVENGLLVKTGIDGKKANPAIAIERDNKILFCRLIRELGFDVQTTPEYTRIPRRYGEEIKFG